MRVRAGYRYTALDANGHRKTGWLHVPDEPALIMALQSNGLELIRCKPGNPLILHSTRITPRAQNMLFQQLAQLLQAGIPLLSAVRDLAALDAPPAMHRMLQAIAQDLESGHLLSQAVQAHAAVFPPWIALLIGAGERTGQLPQVLGHVTRTLSWQIALQAQLRRGLTYPAILCGMVCLAAYVMLTFLVPQMASFLQSLGQTLPASTRVLLVVSDHVQHHGWAYLLGALLIMLCVWLAMRRWPEFALSVEKGVLRLPWIGRLWQQCALVRLCRFLGLMYQSGIPLLQALVWCQPLLQQRVMAQAVGEAHQRLEAGEGLAASFRATGRFPPLMLRMLSIGETTGALDHVLFQLAELYDHEVQDSLDRLLRLLEPMLTLILGALLLFLMVAVMLPIYDSFSMLRG